MKSSWIVGTLLAASLAAPAFGQISVYLGSTPPPLRYEVRPPPPGDGYGWQAGYWGVRGRRYVWVPGRYVQQPYAGAYWNHPHYDHYQQGWQYHEGHWDHEDHDNHRDDNRHDDNRPR